MTTMITSNGDLPRGEGLRELAGRLDIGADIGSLLIIAALVVLGVLVLVGVVLLVLALLRRRRARAPVARAERSWRRRCAGELREVRSARAATARPTWLLVGDPEAGAARLLEGLDARPRPQHPDLPRWWIAPGLRFVAVPEALSGPRRTWLFRQLRRRGARGLAAHGALVPVDAVRLLNDESATLAEVGRHAAALAEIAAALRLELPLVIALTGVERLPGAAEALPWVACGGELHLLADADGIEAALARGLDELRDALVTGLLAHAAAVDAPTTSAALLRTRQHLTGLEAPLRALIRRFDAADAGRGRGHATPRMICLFGHDNARATNGAEPTAPALTGLLTALSGEAQPIRREVIRRRLRGALWTTAVLAVSVALARRIDAEQRDDRAALEATLATLEAAAARPSAPALSRLDALAERWRGETSPRLDGAGLSTALDRYIDAALLRDALDPSAAGRARDLDELVETDLDRASYDRLRDALEDYLRL
ncbi:MAG: hypothetical protein KC486_24500, partial [Myxococcales bacterium]|nr:hypothetical protein [Myxococcales bacterium]